MFKPYVKILTDGGKRYKALIDWKRSNRIFKTATQAEQYAARWKARYKRLKKAQAEFREIQAELARYQIEEDRLEEAASCDEQQEGFVDPAAIAELDYEEEVTFSEPDDECTWEDEP